MKLARSALWVALFALAVDGLRAFPVDADSRARTVCEPLHRAMQVAVALSSSMDERGGSGPAVEPWHHDVHGACVRAAERVFRAVA